ncbi:sugar transferase, partial [bacterium CPR1]|nr:sugar transferase [bacterium CPR1]
ALAVKLDSPGPAFFRQRRCGLEGREFELIKLRTMVAGAHSMQTSLSDQNEVDGPVFKIAKDPRVTKLGRLLRSTSLDELPQLFNVWKGEMSLVGPRPLVMTEMALCPVWRSTRLKVKPGVTGLWQVNGRSGALFHDWIRFDMAYVMQQSLWLDIKILFATARVVLSKAGAY